MAEGVFTLQQRKTRVFRHVFQICQCSIYHRGILFGTVVNIATLAPMLLWLAFCKGNFFMSGLEPRHTDMSTGVEIFDTTLGLFPSSECPSARSRFTWLSITVLLCLLRQQGFYSSAGCRVASYSFFQPLPVNQNIILMHKVQPSMNSPAKAKLKRNQCWHRLSHFYLAIKLCNVRYLPNKLQQKSCLFLKCINGNCAKAIFLW